TVCASARPVGKARARHIVSAQIRTAVLRLLGKIKVETNETRVPFHLVLVRRLLCRSGGEREIPTALDQTTFAKWPAGCVPEPKQTLSVTSLGPHLLGRVRHGQGSNCWLREGFRR